MQALTTLKVKGDLDANIDPNILIERTRDPQHGDFASNLALTLSKQARTNPRKLADQIVNALPKDGAITRVESAGPGLINFFINPNAQSQIIRKIHDEGRQFGRSKAGRGKKVQVEFVSANPTGPLHVGHGRGASYGATVGNLLEAAGYPVHREYYVNDAGRQMDILGASVWLRWLEANEVEVDFPRGGYRGEYIRGIATAIDTSGIEPVTADAVSDGLPENTDENADAYVDALVMRCKELHGEDGFDRIRQQALESIRDEIRDDLAEFGVHFDTWFSEQSLTKTNRVDDALAVLKERGML